METTSTRINLFHKFKFGPLDEAFIYGSKYEGDGRKGLGGRHEQELYVQGSLGVFLVSIDLGIT